MSFGLANPILSQKIKLVGEATCAGLELDTSDLDPVLHETFENLIQKKKDRGFPLLLAVEMNDSGSRFYEATSFNKRLFGDDYLSPCAHLCTSMRERIEEILSQTNNSQVFYFALRDDSFEYFGSKRDLFSEVEKGPTNLTFLTQEGGADAWEARLRLGRLFDSEDTEERLRLAADRNDNSSLEARCKLGLLLEKSGNLAEAEKQLKLAADQNNNLSVAVLASYHLGSLLVGRGELDKAYRYLNLARYQSVDRMISYLAVQRMFEMFCIEQGRAYEEGDA